MVMRAASAIWEGELLTGKGTVSLDSSQAAGPLDVNWPARAENPNGVTSPEELVAAAHATCYAMSLSAALARAGSPAERLDVTAQVHIEKGDTGFAVTRSELRVRGTVPGMDADAFAAAAEGAKENCPISKMVKGNVTLSLDAALA